MKSIFPPAIAKHKPLERVAKKFAGDRLEERYYRDFYSDVSTPLSGNTPKTYLLYSGISSMFLTPVEILLYKALIARGHKLDYLVYDESVKYNEVTTLERLEKEGDRFWIRSTRRGHQMLRAANVDFELISMRQEAQDIVASIEDDPDEIFNFSYEGFEFGQIVRGVMYRFYRSIFPGDNAVFIAKQFLATTLNNYFEFKDRLATKTYDAILFSHGIYCTWQILVDYCEQHGINYICYDRAKTRGHININWCKPSPVWEMGTAWNRLEHYSLTEKEETMVDSYLGERELQTGDVFKFNTEKRSGDLDEIRRTLGIKPGAKVITVFTNLIWDAANVSRDVAFSSPVECIVQTIKRFQDTDDIHILIRPHPAEKIIGTRERYGQLVIKEFDGNLPENVSIAEPELSINSFTILDISSVGVVHTSTVGLEMAIEGKPVILISETHYRGKGFTLDATSPDHYFSLLSNALNESEIDKTRVSLARKYFYLMMFEYQHKFPMEFTSNNNFNGYGKNSLTELLKDEESPFVKTIHGIENNRTDFIFR